jgi:hypothetical protein
MRSEVKTENRSKIQANQGPGRPLGTPGIFGAPGTPGAGGVTSEAGEVAGAGGAVSVVGEVPGVCCGAVLLGAIPWPVGTVLEGA